MQKAGHGKQLLEVISWRSDERRRVLLSALSYADLVRSWLVLGARISLREIRLAPLTLSLALTTLIKIDSTRFSLRSRDVNRTIALSIAIMFGNIQCVQVRAAGGINRCGARSGPARTRFKGMAYHNVSLTVQCIATAYLARRRYAKPNRIDGDDLDWLTSLQPACSADPSIESPTRAMKWPLEAFLAL
jgi:hypothetical protein